MNSSSRKLELQEIEGDEVFLYATRPDGETEWAEVLKQAQTKLLRFFEAFVEAAVGIGEMTACQCAICTHADEPWFLCSPIFALRYPGAVAKKIATKRALRAQSSRGGALSD